ncbi:MAG TPA: DUF4199 domain-containing protein [Bacteroidia bacterium]|nr:DUF4199 domain-containing protein [Bacteroidia bacterium]
MVKTILKYGLVGGLALVLYLYIMLWTGIMYSQSSISRLATLAIVLIPVAVFLSVRELKVKVFNGRLPFVPAFLGGLTVAMMGACVYCIFYFADARFFNLQMSRPMIDMQAEYMRSQGNTEEQVAAMEERYLSHYYSHKPYTNTLWWYLRYGSLYALVSWLILDFRNIKNKLYATATSTKNNHGP